MTGELMNVGLYLEILRLHRHLRGEALRRIASRAWHAERGLPFQARERAIQNGDSMPSLEQRCPQSKKTSFVQVLFYF